MSDATARPMRVVIGGASGLIGAALTAELRGAGHAVQRLVRRPAQAVDEIAWHPETGQIDQPSLEGADAVVHLGGESIAAGRWTPARKAALRRSRVESTSLLAGAIAKLAARPAVFLCASAIGYYGDRGDEVLDESAPPGRGFLPEVCVAWEDATRVAANAGVRTVLARLGIVLARDGGALATMLTPFRLGVGGVLGDGRQYMSWVALRDVIAALRFLLDTNELRGPVNVTAPTPVTNREFTRTLGRALRRPTVLPAPGFAIRALFGEMGQALLLSGARVVPAALQRAGFRFGAPTLDAALQQELGSASK